MIVLHRDKNLCMKLCYINKSSGVFSRILQNVITNQYVYGVQDSIQCGFNFLSCSIPIISYAKYSVICMSVSWSIKVHKCHGMKSFCSVLGTTVYSKNWFFVPFLSLNDQETNDILLLDLSTDIDSNQNCVKGNPFTSSCPSVTWPNPQSSNSPESPFSSQLSFFPAPIPDPFGDDPFSKNDQSAHANSVTPGSFSCSQDKSSCNLNGPKQNGSQHGDTEYFGHQFDERSSKTVIQTLSNGQWPLEHTLGDAWKKNEIPVKEQNGIHCKSSHNPFFESSGNSPPSKNKLNHEPVGPSDAPVTAAKDSVLISPPPLNTKAGRGRRNVKVKPGVQPLLLHALNVYWSGNPPVL